MVLKDQKVRFPGQSEAIHTRTIGCYCSHDRQKRKDNNDRCDTNFWCDARRGATSEDLFYA